MHAVGLKLIISPSILFLKWENVSFDLELIGNFYQQWPKPSIKL